jgi:polar amino acid transport system substrate-binding protein
MTRTFHIASLFAWRIPFAVALAVLVLTGTAAAQVLPRHLDPNERQSAQNPPSPPALRILTTPNFPPFNYRDSSGALVGYNIDLAHAICTELETVCTLQDWPWEQAAGALADNQGDILIGGLDLDKETGTQFDFSSVYLRFPGRFVLPRTGTGTRAFTPESLIGKTVAVRAGSRHADFIARYLPGAHLIEADTEFAALDLVKAGEADAFFGDSLRASFWLGQSSACCDFAGGAYYRPDYFGEGLAIAVAPGRGEVTTALNFALSRLAKSGKMDELYLRWFPVGFY